MPIHKLTGQVTENRWITESVFLLSMKWDIAWNFQAGQFLSMIIPAASAGGKDLRRAYSIASPPEALTQNDPGITQLCVKKVEGGPGTTYLSQLRPGDPVQAMAPYGHFVFKSAPQRHVVFISTGTGVSPFYSIIFSDQYAKSKPLSTTLLFGVRGEKEVLYHQEFSSVPGLQWIPCVTGVTPGASYSGYQGRVTDFIKNRDHQNPKLPDYRETDFYLCGNGAMIKEAKEILLGLGVEKTAIYQEAYF